MHNQIYIYIYMYIYICMKTVSMNPRLQNMSGYVHYNRSIDQHAYDFPTVGHLLRWVVYKILGNSHGLAVKA